MKRMLYEHYAAWSISSIIRAEYAGVAAISFPVYVVASALGKVPGILVYAFIGKHLLDVISGFV